MAVRTEVENLVNRLSLNDEEAEMSLLGAMLLDKDVLIDLMDKVEPADFFKPSHQLLYETLRRLYLENTPIDALTVKNALEQRGHLAAVGGHEYLVALMEMTPITANAPQYARIVRQKALMRRLARACAETLSDLEQPGTNVEDLVNQAQKKMFEIAQDRSSRNAMPMSDVIEQAFKQIEDFFKMRGARTRLLGLSTGLIDLDEALCGLQPAYFYVVAGRPGMGKSSLCFRMMETIGVPKDKAQERPVLFFSLEMSATQVSQQMLCSYCKVDSHKIRKGDFGHPELKTLSFGAARMVDAPVWIDDSPDLSIYDLRTRARRMKAKHNVGIVLVDYLQKLRAPGAESRQVEISLVASQLKSMAKELEIPVVAVAQLNRSPEGREDRRPMLSDLRESGAIEQDADVVIMVYREEYYRPTEDNKNKCDLDIVKNRMGPAGRVNVVFKKEWTRFETYDYERHPEQPAV